MVSDDPSETSAWFETVRTDLWFPDGDTQWKYAAEKGGWPTDPSTRIKIL